MNPNAKKTAKTARASSSKSAAGASRPGSSSLPLPAVPPAIAASPPGATTPPIDAVAPISAGVVAQCLALLAQIDALIGPVKQLSAADIRRAVKLRKGGAQVIGQVIDLCTHHGLPAVGPVTVQAMSAQVARATALNQIGVPVGAVQKKLSDATFSAESGSWQYATALYTTLKRLALVDPTLAVGLQPVEAFFQTKRTKGTQRATKAQSKKRKADVIAAKYAEPGTDPAAHGATPNGNGAPPAPVATVAPATPAPGVVAHS